MVGHGAPAAAGRPAALPPTLRWVGGVDGRLELLDQTRLPAEESVLALHDEAAVVAAIRRLAVRGAPAIGVAGAYAVLLGVRAARPRDAAAFAIALEESIARVGAARPTAVNLAAALAKVRTQGLAEPRLPALLAAADALATEDAALCRALAEHGAELVRDGATVLTHCNTGRLATAGEGTALALLFEAHRRGRRFQVLVDETRPLLQGARLTALELSRSGIACALLVDSAAAGLIARGEVDLVLTGADRIARNGDAANKVGTYGLALAAAAHDVPFWIVAPHTTIDLATPTGAAIPIEERAQEEVLELDGHRIAAPFVAARNPAFDITPAHLLTGLVTDRGRVSPVDAAKLTALFQSDSSIGRSPDHEFGTEPDEGRAGDHDADAQGGREAGPSLRTRADPGRGT